jgi:hypothetical protein
MPGRAVASCANNIRSLIRQKDSVCIFCEQSKKFFKKQQDLRPNKKTMRLSGVRRK